jgi:hypothetical protein
MMVTKSVDHLFGNNSTTEADEFCSQLIQHQPDRVFLTALWEAYQYRPFIGYIDNFMHSRGIHTTWVLNSFVVPNIGWNKLLCQTVFLDFCVWRVYNEVIVKQKSKINPAWNPNADRFLFLTGKPDKINRVRLLYKLEQANLLQHCDYSFFMNSGMQAKSSVLIPELTPVEFGNFVWAHAGKSPDAAKVVEQESSCHYGGIPYHSAIYANALFKLVPETAMHFSPAFITEKTWLSVINHCPVVIAGDRNSCSYLETLKMHGFDKLFDIESYDDLSQPEDRLNKIILHVQAWLDKKFNKQQVQEMVEQNFNQFIALAQNTKQKFELETGYNIDQVVDTRDDITKF